MDKMINLRLVPKLCCGQTPDFGTISRTCFSVIADDDSILLIVTNEGIISQIEQTVRGW